MDSTLTSAYAVEMLRLADEALLAEPLTTRTPGLSVNDAYAIARNVLAGREAAGWRRIGRKVGFTNRTILAQYGVYAPIFGYMYDQTVVMAESGSAVLSLHGLVQPRIEPEIIFKLRQAPPATADAGTLLQSIEWLAHGFEIVQCHFPGWRFSAPDCIADGGLHGRYVVGQPLAVEHGQAEELADELASFRIALTRGATLAAEGGGEYVLGSPLNALLYLMEVLDGLPDHPPLEAGEIVTTGTLTSALPVKGGESWSTQISGLSLPGLHIQFE